MDNPNDVNRPAEVPPVTVVEKEDEVDQTSNSLVWVSSVAGFLSWAVLLVALVYTGLSVADTILSGGSRLGFNAFTLVSVLNWVIPLLVGGFFFVLLQWIAKSIFVMLDICDNTSRVAELLEDRTRQV